MASVKFFLNEYTNKEDIYNAIDDIFYDEGNTNIAHAIEMTRTEMFTRRNGDRFNVPNLGILITDGEAKVNAKKVRSEPYVLERVVKLTS